MATAPREVAEPTDPAYKSDPSKNRYDRSSLKGGFMAMIADHTVEDYVRRSGEKRFCEYIDEIVYMPSPVMLGHQFEVQFLTLLLELFTTRRRADIVLTGPASLRAEPDHSLEADLFVIPPGGEMQFRSVYCDHPALLVIEVLSTSTRSNDLNRKSELCRQAGAIEIWLVDHRDEVLIVHRRSDDGHEVERIQSGLFTPGLYQASGSTSPGLGRMS